MSNLIPGYSPRSSLKYNIQEENKLIERIALNMDKNILAILHQDIRSKELAEDEFVTLIMKNLNNFDLQLANREIRLTKALLEMFNQITIGKEKVVNWGDLSDYFIHKGRSAKKQNSKFDEHNYSKAIQQPKVRCQSKILKCLYIKSLDIILYCEQYSNIIQVLDPNVGVLSSKPIIFQTHKLTIQSSTVRRQKGKTVIANKDFVVQTNITIMDFIYVEQGRYNILLCSLSHGLVTGMSYNNGNFVAAFHPDNDAQRLQYHFQKVPYCLQWDSLNETLYCGCENDTIIKWSFKTSIIYTLQSPVQEHLVTCLINISKLQIIAASYMDGKLILWDTVTNQKKSIFKQHIRGILTMAFSESQMLLFSAGFDHLICVWNPYVQGVIHKIPIHLQTILKLEVIPNEKLLSMDEKGNIVIFSTKTFNVINSLVIESTDSRPNSAPTTLCVMNNPHKLVVCGYSLIILTFDSIKSKDYADSQFVSSICYFQNSLQLVTTSGEKIKKWSILTGQIDMIHTNQSMDITSMGYDTSRSLIYVGSKNKVSVFNSKNMFKIKELPLQNADVDLIVPFIQAKNDNLIAIVEGLSNVHIYKEISQNKHQLLKQFNVNKDVAISAMIYNYFDNNLIIGTNVGVIGIYDIQSGKSISATGSTDQFSETVGLHLVELQNLNILIEVTRIGTISILLLSPKLGRVYSCKVKDCENSAENQKVTCSDIDSRTLKLWIGDEKGYIVSYGLKIVCDQIDRAYLKLQANKSKHEDTRKYKQSYNINSPIERLWMFKTHNDSVSCIRYLANQGLIISAGYDRRVRIRNQNGQYINQLKQSKDTKIEALFYVERKGKKLEVYADYTAKKTIATKGTIQLSEDEVFNPKFIIQKLELKDLNSLLSNPGWKVNIDFVRYCQDKKGKYKKFLQKFKKIRPNVQKKLMLPKLRENLQKSINESLNNIFNSEEAKHNYTIQTSFINHPKIIKTESLPKISTISKVRHMSRDNIDSLSKPRFKGSPSSMHEKPRVDIMSKEVRSAYNRLNSILFTSVDTQRKITHSLLKRRNQ